MKENRILYFIEETLIQRAMGETETKNAIRWGISKIESNDYKTVKIPVQRIEKYSKIFSC